MTHERRFVVYKEAREATPVRRGIGAAAYASGVGVAALVLYRSTLLPGVDFGDTAFLQATAGSRVITPRNAYPLYFAIGNALLWLTRGDPAFLLNIASAVEAATACAVIALVAAELSGSRLAGLGASSMFAVSYTFWSQAIIAEVYALHILFVALTLLLLLRWQRRPTLTRLALFFAVFALGFGNHLSMILLAPAYTVFILVAAPGGWRTVITPRIVLIAVLFAIAGASQYAWNFRGLFLQPYPPHGFIDAVRTFWFDVTKSDWRDTLVLNVPRSMFGDRAAMYWFDLRQQVGFVGPLVASVGIVHLTQIDWKRAMLISLLYAANVGFAFSYNVGDSHVFYLPSHLVLALLTAPAIALTGRWNGRARTLAAVALTGYAAVRGYRDWPALDRSDDTRAAEALQQLTKDLDDRHTILLADMNWQVQNGLAYFTKVVRPEVAYTAMSDVLLYAPALVADNTAVGRSIALTPHARDDLVAAYGPLLPTVEDPRTVTVLLSALIRDLPLGTRYVLCVLRPSRDVRLDAVDVSTAAAMLTGGRSAVPDGADYVALAGTMGDAATAVIARNRPFHASVDLGGVPVEIRMESWLASDTIRRMGFGHVIAGRRHLLIVERGVSFVALDTTAQPIRRAYAANIFAPQRRYLIDTRVLQR